MSATENGDVLARGSFIPNSMADYGEYLES